MSIPYIYLYSYSMCCSPNVTEAKLTEQCVRWICIWALESNTLELEFGFLRRLRFGFEQVPALFPHLRTINSSNPFVYLVKMWIEVLMDNKYQPLQEPIVKVLFVAGICSFLDFK